MITCNYSYARDCSECNEPVCLRYSYLSPNDYDEPDPYDEYSEEDR